MAIADKVNSLIQDLIKAGFKDAALSVATRFSDFDNKIWKDMPFTQLELAHPVNFDDPGTVALLHRDLEIKNLREKSREEYFNRHIAPYGLLLMYSLN